MNRLLPRIVMAALIASPLAWLAALPARALGGKTAVDVEIVLAVDISYSMNPEEQRLQRAGYVAALTSPEFLAALKSGPTGRIAIEYIEWSSRDDQSVLINWSLIDGPATAKLVAGQLGEAPYRRASRTSISGGIDAAMRSFQNNGFNGARRIIDVSGDGPNNDGRLVTAARDDALAKNVTINGLPLVGIRPYVGPADIPDLDVYYQDCVVGGPDSFMLPVHDVKNFVEATRTKLVREVASRGTLPITLASASKPRISCTIGEDRFMRRWGN